MLCKLPQDILQFHIAPYLSSLTELNECLPQRVYRKFDTDYAQQHHKSIIVKKWSQMLNNIEHCRNDTRFLIIYRLLQDLQRPLNAFMYKYDKFKHIMIAKMLEFIESRDTIISPKFKRMLNRKCSALVQFILSL